MIGLAMLALQVALSARLRWADRPFGIDRVTRWHKRAAIVACVLLLAHPILLAVSMGNVLLFGFATSWKVGLGKMALLLVLAVVLVALYFPLLRLDYQKWRLLHKGAIGVVILGLLHGMLVGSDMQSVGMRACWWLLGGLALGLFVYRNLYVPLWGRRRFRVTGVRQTTHDTYTVSLEQDSGSPLHHQPGQFMFLKLLRPGRASEEHPFTIASSPAGEPPLEATIKESGGYTDTIGETRAGDEALIEGPYGRFSFRYRDAESVLFIAGGVGITPILSMLRALRDSGDVRPAVLLWANRTEADIGFRNELASLPAHMAAVHVLSQPDDGWNGPTGLIAEQIIQEHAGHVLATASVYLCGPPPMMVSVSRALRELGVPRPRIITERFAL
jgi:predicted ferric reductase